MINELFSFQKQAVNELRFRVALALNNYHMLKVPQVVSLQAPTGSGKTIIMSALIEDIYFGSENFTEQPNAIFVWLSDSPQLNEQSKQKIELKADKIRMGQCVSITDESFDQETLDDGHIYFLNTQKLGKAGNLSQHSDTRQYTIWETIENTAKTKADRLYFIIDEAHRGMQGRSAGTATTIMQRFIKGSPDHKLSPVPVVIGMSATAARFNALVGSTNSTQHNIIISPNQVRASGLLKERIVITYPDDPTKHNDMAVLAAATDEWMDKCQHWYQYTYEQHYTNVNPVFVIQVTAGSGKKVSDTNLDDVIAKIEERTGKRFKEHEVVHTFGSTGDLQMNGLTVHHVEPSEIANDRRISVVLFKENLSTGWDCPRAETMMSFRKAEDATYIAQLLGRMIRTPLQCHILVDDSLNDVRLYLPYFNRDNVQKVIDELQSAEGGEIPTVIDGESLEEQTYVSWSVHTGKHRGQQQVPGQTSMFGGETDLGGNNTQAPAVPVTTNPAQNTQQGQAVSTPAAGASVTPAASSPANAGSIPMATKPAGAVTTTPVSTATQQPASGTPTTVPTTAGSSAPTGTTATPFTPSSAEQLTFLPTIDRESVIKFINEQGYLTYVVRSVKVNSYLKSLLSLAGLLTQYNIYPEANDTVYEDLVALIHDYVTKLHDNGEYDDLAQKVVEMKLSIQVFDVFGETIETPKQFDMFDTTDIDLDRQLQAANARLGNCGLPQKYGLKYLDWDNLNAFKIDCILFAFSDECIAQVNKYAEKKFHELNDTYRKYVVNKSEKCRKQYSDIVANGDIVSKHNFTLPETISAKVEAGGTKYTNHLYADYSGYAVIKLNGWESDVLAEEMKRGDFFCWLRNPPRQSWSLRIPYEMGGATKEAYPDFIIIREDTELGFVMDILEPHNPEFKDNLAKAKGFAQYAIEEQKIGRIQLIRTAKDAAGKTRFRRLDMAKGTVRNKVLAAINNDELDHIFDTDGEF